MVTKTTGKITPKGKPSLRREASADDPIYTQGFVVGARNLKNSSKTTATGKESSTSEESTETKEDQD